MNPERLPPPQSLPFPVRSESTPPVYGLWLAGLIFLALALRMFNANAPFISSLCHRSYVSAVIVRSWFCLQDPSAPDWKRSIAQQNLDRTPAMEPRILERLTLWGYRWTGECFWLPRLWSSLFWCLAAVPLFRLIASWQGPQAALLSVLFYLFMPFSIFASRLFQPDPLMVALMIAATWALWREIHKPSVGSWLAAAFFLATAMLVKIPCSTILFPAAAALALERFGLIGAIRSCRLWALAIVASLPAVAYYGSGLLITGALRYQVGVQWNPSHYLQADYWLGWGGQVLAAVGIPALVLALYGAIRLPVRSARALVFGLGIGYLLYGLIFTQAVSVGEYTHLSLVPIVALAIGPGIWIAVQRFKRTGPGFRIIVSAVCVLLVVMLGAIALSPANSVLKQHISPSLRGNIERALNLCGASTLHLRQWNWRHEDTIQTAVQIGSRVGHSDRVLLLSSGSGHILIYHGWVALWYWPSPGPEASPPRPDDLSRVEAKFREISDSFHPDYFVAWHISQLQIQPVLKTFLESRFPVVERTDSYVIFDLRSEPPHQTSSTPPG